MSIRGKAAITGLGWLKPQRSGYPGRSSYSLQAEAAVRALADASLTKEQIDGFITQPPGDTPHGGHPGTMADMLGLRPKMASDINQMGATGAVGIAMAAAWINAGLCTNVLITLGAASRIPYEVPRQPGGEQWGSPYGPTVAANGEYALLANRHKFEYGTSDSQRARVAMMQRFNAQANPDAAFYGQPITTEDVLNSRMVSDPLHLLECVMPVAGAIAFIVSSSDQALSMPHDPCYILGVGHLLDHNTIATHERGTVSPVSVSAPRAFRMAGVGPKDMDLAEMYDCYTITVMVNMEDAGFIPKGESGPWMEENDITYKGNFPVNTHGGQLSFGQWHGNTGGASQVMEGALQMMGRAGQRQVRDAELCFVNG